MKRDSSGLAKYRKACQLVIDRASETCEVMLDEFGDAISEHSKTHRCGKVIPFDKARAINFLHKDTRNGKSDEWVCDPDNIIYGCAEHHIQEEQLGGRVQQCSYEDDLVYVPEYD